MKIVATTTILQLLSSLHNRHTYEHQKKKSSFSECPQSRPLAIGEVFKAKKKDREV